MAQKVSDQTRLNKLIDKDSRILPEYIDTTDKADYHAFQMITEVYSTFYKLNTKKFLSDGEIDVIVEYFDLCVDAIFELKGAEFVTNVVGELIINLTKYQEFSEDNEVYEFLANSNKFMERSK